MQEGILRKRMNIARKFVSDNKVFIGIHQIYSLQQLINITKWTGIFAQMR